MLRLNEQEAIRLGHVVRIKPDRAIVTRLNAWTYLPRTHKARTSKDHRTSSPNQLEGAAKLGEKRCEDQGDFPLSSIQIQRRRNRVSILSEAVKIGAKHLKRMPMHVLLRKLVTWQPQGEPEPGYSVVIACIALWRTVAVANLRLCARCNASNLHEIILVFDCLAHEIPDEVTEAVRDVAPSTSVRLFGYSVRQDKVRVGLSGVGSIAGCLGAWLSARFGPGL